MPTPIKAVPAAAPSALDSAVASLARLGAELGACFYERGHVIPQILDSLVAGEHVLLLGEPGTAKSDLTEAIRRAFDSEYFGILMSRFTTPDEVFGPFDPKALTEQGRLCRKPDGYLPTAGVVFLDEVFKASSAINNALLQAINERQWRNDGALQSMPLRFVMGASNEIPADDSGLEAFFDRFLSRFWIKQLQDDQSARDLFFGQRATVTAKVSFAELDVIRSHAASLPFTADAQDAVLAIRTEIRARGIIVSDRRWKKACGLLRAHAARRGLSVVTTACLSPLENVLWSKPEQAPIVREVVASFAATWMNDVRAIAGVIDEQSTRLADVLRKSSNLSTKLRDFAKVMAALEPEEIKLAELVKTVPDAAEEAQSLLDRIAGMFDLVKQAGRSLGA